MTHTTDNCIYLQSAEIFKNALVSVRNNLGIEFIKQNMINTNYLSIETTLPKGEYLLIVEEEGNSWKKSVYL